MSDLPSHASHEACKRERTELRIRLTDFGDFRADPWIAEVVAWLLDECDHLDAEYDSMRRECERWHAEAMRLTEALQRFDGDYCSYFAVTGVKHPVHCPELDSTLPRHACRSCQARSVLAGEKASQIPESRMPARQEENS